MPATVEQIKALRELTGAGVMECKEVLEQTGGNQDQAVAVLREKGFAQAAKRSGRETTEGVVEAYIHTGGRVGALVELGCETDFVARTPEFRELAHNVAMQVAAMDPTYVSASDISGDDSRPPEQVTLMLQPFIKETSKQVGDIVQELAAKVGENVRVIRFSRLAVEE